MAQKADDSLTLSRRGFHVEPGAREKAVSPFFFVFVVFVCIAESFVCSFCFPSQSYSVGLIFNWDLNAYLVLARVEVLNQD